MNTIMMTVSGLIAGATLLVGLGGCHSLQSDVSWHENGQPRHSHSQQSWWSYKYVYYPHEQVYFEPYSRTYFWFNEDRWEEGDQLPDHITVHADDANIVRLQEPKPYLQHVTTLQWSWPHTRAIVGSTDAFHATPEAIAASERRAAERNGDMVASLEEDVDSEEMPFLLLEEPMEDSQEDPTDYVTIVDEMP